jgi:cytochrome c-type biogenesis protein CcmH
MTGLLLFAAFSALATVWFLARAVRARAAPPADRDGLEQLRDRLLAQLRELDVEEGDRNIDGKVAVDERARIEAELVPVLRELEIGCPPLPPGEGPGVRESGAEPPQPSPYPSPGGRGDDGSQMRSVMFVLVLLLPLVSISLYFLNSADALKQIAQSPAPVARNEVPPMAREMVARLEQRLKEQPNDPQGWARLGRSYDVLGRGDDAQAAYTRAYQLASEDPEIISAYAAFLMSRDQSRMSAETVGLFRKLHKLEPNHAGALWALGFASYQEQNFSDAIGYWDRLLKLLPPDSEVVSQLKHAIDSARSEAAKAR